MRSEQTRREALELTPDERVRRAYEMLLACRRHLADVQRELPIGADEPAELWRELLARRRKLLGTTR